MSTSPISTYRLQLNHQFNFEHAAEIAGYLSDLGIGACYVSPVLKARPGSGHGYDVIDHGVLNPEIGSPEQLRTFAGRLKQLGMGLVLDVVPNHMCVADLSNAWWFDILENGPSSPYSRFFDIDWAPPRDNLADKVLLPILGDQYGRVLENQQLRVEYRDGAFVVCYYEIVLPLAPRSWPSILESALQHVRSRLGDADGAVLELESVITAIGYLPLRTETDPVRIRERLREKEIIKLRLHALSSRNECVASAIAGALDTLNGVAGEPRSFDALERLLAEQAYRLSYWRVASDEINYRRFFDINELAALRTEDSAVFEATHRLIFDLIREGWITGLRIDHPDGLFDPARYFEDLRAAVASNGHREHPPPYVVAEKVVSGDEALRENWAVEGTTGYAFLNYLNGLFVYPGSKTAFCRLYERWTGWDLPYSELVYRCKRLILRASMSSELNVLARRLDRICQQHRHSRDFTLESLRLALAEVIACFPVYRTYITEATAEPDPEDWRHIEKAIREAKKRNPATNESVFNAIGSILLLQEPAGATAADRAERRNFVMRLQQLTGPVMAKGVEDTAFYRYYPLASLNEVGGDPNRFGVTPRHFHAHNLETLRRWPKSLLATSTHDTKRSEDVRARISVLSEIPVKWYEAVRRWSQMNRSWKKQVDGVDTPDHNAEYLLYQTLVGVWPATPFDAAAYADLVRRVQDYMDKALKEAKLRTSWINPNQKHDLAVRDFVAAILDPDRNKTFLTNFREFVVPIAKAGMYNSLSQLLLKIASPGVPDFYQGSETWDLSLVDPDNRRPVDFTSRRAELHRLEGLGCPGTSEAVAPLLRDAQDGRIKLFITSRGLRFRRCHADLFESGAYHPISAGGTHRQHVVAFARKHEGKLVIAVAGRFFLKLGRDLGEPVGHDYWDGTALLLPHAALATEYLDILSGNLVRPEPAGSGWKLPLPRVFSVLPVALLQAREPHGSNRSHRVL